MSLDAQHSKRFIAEVYEGTHDVTATAALYIILMDTGYVWDWEADSTYADVKADEIATANGYTKITKALTGVSVVEGGVGVHPIVTCDNTSWTAATAGPIETTKGACVVAGTADASTIVGFIDFGGNFSTPASTTLTIDFSSGLMAATVENV